MSSAPLLPLVLALAFAVTVVPACSFLVDLGATQCQSDADCARFPRTVCERGSHLCVAKPVDEPGTGGSGGQLGAGTGGVDGLACQDATGCVACAPGSAVGFMNACNGGACVPFDNQARLAKVGPAGGLRPLP